MANTPAYGACQYGDHSALKASLDTFASTTRNTMQSDGEGGWLLLGNCPSCHTALAIQIALARGNAVKGTIDDHEATELAKKYIR